MGSIGQINTGATHSGEGWRAHTVPPEIIREILLTCATTSSSVEQTLLFSLICRESYTWMTRLLYRSVTLSSLSRLQLFARAITLNSDLASHVRALYIGPVHDRNHTLQHGVISPNKTVVRVNGHHAGPVKLFDDTPALVELLNRVSPSLEHLALIDIPPSTWPLLQGALYTQAHNLRTLALAPSHGMLNFSAPAFSRRLEMFHYLDGPIPTYELRRIAGFAHAFKWRLPLSFDRDVYELVKLVEAMEEVEITLFSGTEDGHDEKEKWEELLRDGKVRCDEAYSCERREWVAEFRKGWMARVLDFLDF